MLFVGEGLVWVFNGRAKMGDWTRRTEDYERCDAVGEREVFV